MRTKSVFSLLLAVSLLGACGGRGTPSAGTTTTPATPITTAPTTTAPTTTGPAPSTTAPAPTTTAGRTVDLRAYFLRGEALAITHRAVPATPAVLRAALEALLAGPTPAERAAGLGTAIPDGTRLLDLALADGVATVDLSGTFDDGGGSFSLRARVAQVVFTATQFDNVDGVLFRLDGEPVEMLGGEGLLVDTPQQRMSYEDISGPILIDQPQPGATVRSPLRVTGESDTYEAVLILDLLNASGAVLVSQVVMATSGMGTWGTFEATLTFEAPPGPLTLRATESTGVDPSEGPPARFVDVPLVAA